MSKKPPKSTPAKKPSVNSNPLTGGVKGQVPKMQNPPPPPKKK